MIEITRISIYSGITRTRLLDITEEQYRKYNNGTNAQDAFPQLSPDDREFIMTGITPDEWSTMFPET